MARAFPPDVVVLDTDGLLHARVSAGKRAPQIDQANAYRLPAGTFTPGVVTPELTNPSALADALRRLRLETGRWDTVSILLPDSWFRINLIEMPSLPDRTQEAMEAVRWSLKRTLPIDPITLRVTYVTLGKTINGVKLLVLSAVDSSLAAIESTFAAAGINVVLLEPIGLNIWNAISTRESSTSGERIFVYVREHDFTTALFRGTQPVFIRSRNLSGDRSVHQELRLSASYLRDSVQASGVERCYIAGNAIGADVESALAAEFEAPVSTVSLADFAERLPADVTGMQAELMACTGVFAG